MNIMLIFSYAWACAAVVMLVMWILQIRSQNAGFVDVTWAFLTPLMGVWLILADEVDDGMRQYLIIGMALFWGIRLGSYLYKRVSNETEDGRYRYMREYCGKNANVVFFIFFQIQASWTLLFALPFWAAARNAQSSLGWLDYMGLAVWLVAMLGEWLSDKQLAQFKLRTKDRSVVCSEGLWRYSRHPNYFFEWLHWWAFVCLGYGSDYWWLTWTGLLVMYVFITRITGLPYTEQQSLRSKGAAYRNYQQSTSSFFPLPPRARTKVNE
ncbi:MAG: steroid 5-alpha reductase family enzyme [Gammaproteobacteria bacterium]|jgi:steroid 5-alpha reductase family enzyme